MPLDFNRETRVTGRVAKLLHEAISMDPALGGLDVAERYKRSRRLLEAGAVGLLRVPRSKCSG